ncbi:MAG: efflux transporter outer membrane subunit, partial [Mucilaginibacter sp.]|uniref:efflux transporter outer membrane subunit n=1 Tax=Mucilaginibacter sp. TaxID=1882438 RepID=UPI0031A0A3EE
MKIKYSWVIPALIIISSCRVTSPYHRPAVNQEGLYREQSGTDTANNIALVHWDTYFQDPALQNLIREGLANNLDLKSALERINAARAEFQSSKSAFLPSLSGNASVTQERLAYPQAFGFVKDTRQYAIGLSASWEMDIWGKLSSAKRAAFASLLQQQAVKQAVQSELVAAIASDYYLLAALDEQLDILKRTAANRQEDVNTVKALQASNVVNGAAVVQSQANYYATEVAIPGITRQIRKTENALCVLLGKAPGPINRNALRLQQMPVGLNTGVPAQLLANRPDVQEAELAFRVAFEQTNIARSYFYPSLTLTAAGGFSSFSVGDWFTRNLGLFGNVTAGILQPIYNKGINKARLRTAKAQQQVALNSFQQSLLVAGQEVSDALFAYQTVE